MHPSYGVPWPRLARAAARLEQLHAPQPEPARLHSLLFLAGLTYVMSYRAQTNRRLTHYLDDGLREAVDDTLPILMRHTTARRPNPAHRLEAHQRSEFDRLAVGFRRLLNRLPAPAARWVGEERRASNLVRLSFGMGVTARFSPDAHQFTRGLLEHPVQLQPEIMDVLHSFRWSPEWSVALAR